MADPVSNHNRAVVTQGTAHVARTKGCTDTCLDPATKKTQDFENQIPSTKLDAGKTVRTKIDKQPIMVRGTKIGPPSEGSQPPFILGVRTMMPHNNFAEATSWSPDVKAEGRWVVRTDDTTFQNRANTTGFMDGSQLKGNQVTEAEFQKLKCSLGSVLGVSGARTTGLRSAKATKKDYIEILTGDVVDLESIRWDATVVVPPPVIDPACALEPKHTKWKAVRTGGGVDPKEKTGAGKKFQVDTGLTKAGFPTFTMSRTAEAPTTSASASQYGTRSATETADKAGTVSGDWGAAIKLLGFYVDPCVIKVDAMACANNIATDIRVYPQEPLKISIKIGKETNDKTRVTERGKNIIADKIYAVFGKFKDLTNFLNNILGCADIELKFTLFDGFKLDFELGYKYCDKTLTTRSGDWRSTNHCGLYWKLDAGCGTLISFTVSVSIPLIRLVATFLTGGGGAVVCKVLKKIEDVAGITLAIKFTAAIGVGFMFNFGIDQHDEITAGQGTCTIKPEFKIELVLALSNAEARAGGGVAGTITLQAKGPRPEFFMAVASTGALAGKAWVSGRVFGRILWIGPEYDIGKAKEFELFNFELWKGEKRFLEAAKKTP